MSDEDLEKKHLKFTSPKETSYCLFEKKLRYTLKMEKTKVMSKLHASTRVGK